MKEDYNKAMEKLALNLSNAFGNPLRFSFHYSGDLDLKTKGQNLQKSQCKKPWKK